MNETSKLLLAVVIGGTVLGAGLSEHVSTLMNPGPQADWRDRYRPSYSGDPAQFVDAGPIDLTPSLPWPGARFGLDAALDAAMAQPPADYGLDYGAGYETGDFAMPQHASDDLIAESSSGSAPPAAIEEALQEAAASARKLQQTAGQPAAGDPTSQAVSGVGRPSSLNGFEAIGTAAGLEMPTAL